MTQLTADARPILWAVRIGGEVILTGETPVGAVTVTSHDIVGSTDENEFLGALAEVSEIPGEWVSGEQGIQIGDRRTYQGVIYECRQNPGINIWPPPTVPALWLVIGPE